METDPTKDDQSNQDSPDPEATDDPGKVTVDEPTKPALSGTESDDFGDEEGTS
jgi:hypothetical protein